MSGYVPTVGERVTLGHDLIGQQVTVSAAFDRNVQTGGGRVVGYTEEPTVIVRGSDGVARHHVASLVRHAALPEPTWWPPHPGDVITIGDHAQWMRRHILGEQVWVTTRNTSTIDDSDVLATHRRNQDVRLLVRDGKSVQP